MDNRFIEMHNSMQVDETVRRILNIPGLFSKSLEEFETIFAPYREKLDSFRVFDIGMKAIKNNRFDLLKIIVVNTSHFVNVCSNDGNLLDKIIQQNNFEMIKWLLDEKNILAHITPERFIGEVIRYGNLDLLKWIDADPRFNNALINLKDLPEESPIEVAILYSKLEILKWLIDEKGFSLSEKNSHQDMLHLACSNFSKGRHHIVQWLLQEKKHSIKTRCVSPSDIDEWDDDNSLPPPVDIFQLFFTEKTNIEHSYPVLITLIKANSIFFKESVLAFTVGDLQNLSAYLLALADQQLHTLIPIMFTVINQIWDQHQTEKHDVLLELFFSIALNKKKMLNDLLKFAEKINLDEIHKADIQILSKLSLTQAPFISENELSDIALRFLVSKLQNLNCYKPCNHYLQLIDVIKVKTDCDRISICGALIREMQAEIASDTKAYDYLKKLNAKLVEYLTNTPELYEQERLICVAQMTKTKIYILMNTDEFTDAAECWYELLRTKLQGKEFGRVYHASFGTYHTDYDFTVWSACFDEKTLEHRFLHLIFNNNDRNPHVFSKLCDAIINQAQHSNNIHDLLWLRDCLEYLKLPDVYIWQYRTVAEKKSVKVEALLTSLNNLQTIIGNSSAPLIALLTKVQTLSSEVATLKSEATLFRKNNKRSHKGEEAGEEPLNKKQRTLDGWTFKKC